jgi:uncharacterized membrane protein
MKLRTKYILILLLLLGVFLRFYNLNWGAPFYFHPDERNIAIAVSQLELPNQMNPNFFAYGSLPIYAIYFMGLIKNVLTNLLSTTPLSTEALARVGFEDALVIGRSFSALFSLLLIPLLFYIGAKIKDRSVGLFAAALAALSTGLIQFAHFATFEIWLTLFGTLLFWLVLKYIEKPRIKTATLIGLVFGILASTKVSSLTLLPIPILVIYLKRLKNNGAMEQWSNMLIFSVATTLVFLITNLYTFLDSSSFISSMKYESTLAAGSLPVFYTQGFYDTTPVLFQFLHIYPFLINPLLTVLFIPAFFYVLIKGFKTKNKSYLILASFYLILFLPQAFLHAKWTRYMVPTLPFMYLILAVALGKFYSSSEALAKSRNNNKTMKQFNSFLYSRQARTIIIGAILASSIIFSTSYFTTAFIRPDTRIEAAEFARKHFPNNSRIITEPYDLGVMPFNNVFKNIQAFNFYDLETDQPAAEEELQTKLAQSEYIIIPSQRLLRSRLQNPDSFPHGHQFYSGLVSGRLGFEKIYQTPCDIFCKIAYPGNTIFSLEETATVFDRPTVFIFKKME